MEQLADFSGGSFTPMGEAIEAICAEHGLPKLAGGSGMGWSRWKTLQECPYKYQLIHLKKTKIDPSLPLETGTAFHAFMALHYQAIINALENRMLGLAPVELKDRLLEVNVNPAALHDGWRIFDAYCNQYADNDYLRPLAVELPAEDPRTGLTCRYDLLAEVVDPPPNAPPGIYVTEHKSSGKFDLQTLEGWDLDGEILGEMALYNRAGLNKKYGKLTGVIVNIVGKQKIPQFHRTIVVTDSVRTMRHIRDLEKWMALELQYKKARYFPRALSSCIGRYGMCAFYDHCRNGG